MAKNLKPAKLQHYQGFYRYFSKKGAQSSAAEVDILAATI